MRGKATNKPHLCINSFRVSALVFFPFDCFFWRKPKGVVETTQSKGGALDAARLPFACCSSETLTSDEFGRHFNEPVFTDLYRDLETVKLQPMEYLFRVGDADDCMYIVKTGQMYLYSQPQDEPQTLIKKLSSGDNLTSLLSFLDLLTGGESRFITMSACAAEDGATVIRLR